MAEAELEKASQISRARILEFEKRLSQVAGAIFGDSTQLPLKHSFAKGIYVREIFIPKGTFIVSKIHKESHPVFLMKGKILVASESGGVEHLEAPLSMISKAGTKRIGYAVEDTVWITVHATTETDLEKIECEVIAKTYDEITSEKGEIECPG